MRDKDAAAMLETLIPRARAAVFTKPRIERASEPAVLKTLAGRFALGSKLAGGARGPAGGGGSEPEVAGGAGASGVSDGGSTPQVTDGGSSPDAGGRHPPAPQAGTGGAPRAAGGTGREASRSGHISTHALLLCESDIATALAAARRLARPGETILVAGSLFLVGAVKEILERSTSPGRSA